LWIGIFLNTANEQIFFLAQTGFFNQLLLAAGTIDEVYTHAYSANQYQGHYFGNGPFNGISNKYGCKLLVGFIVYKR
jgi:hypothetical protein